MNSIFDDSKLVGRLRSINDERRTVKTTNDERSTFNLEKRSNSRVSFKRSRVDLYNQSMIQ